MTVILAYSNLKEKESIGVLGADNKVVYNNSKGLRSEAKGDKLTKIQRRFTVGITGLEAVDYVIGNCFGYFEQFDNVIPTIDTIDTLAYQMQLYFSYIFHQYKTKGFLNSASKESANMNSQLIVLDCVTNKLYFTNLGKVWDKDNSFDIKFTELISGQLYCFGAVVPEKSKKTGYIMEPLDSLNESEIHKYLQSKIKQFKTDTILRRELGNLGALQINVLGSKPYSSYTSAFNSVIEYVNTLIARQA